MKKLDKDLHRSGIYRIVGPSGLYYGSSHKFCKRRAEHKRTLRLNKHHAAHLQRAWNKYGENAFSFEIVSFMDINELRDAEQKWLDSLFECVSTVNIYNSSRSARHPGGIKKTPEQIKAHVERMTGRKLSEEHKAKISKSLIGNTRTLGVKFSEDARNAIALGHSGGKSYTVMSPDGEIFNNVTNVRKFCRDHGLLHTGLLQVLSGKYKQSRGWTGYLENKEV